MTAPPRDSGELIAGRAALERSIAYETRNPRTIATPVFWYHPCAMARGLRELVGRVMIDPDFLADLQRAPDVVLGEYELTPEERATVEQALARLARSPSSERAHALRNALIRRVAT